MTLQEFVARTRLPVSAAQAYAWHARPGALQRISPPWQHVRVLEQGDGIDPGTRVVVQLRAGPLRRRWVAVHGACEEGRVFRDWQQRGPFAHWEHEHRFVPDGEDACWLEDRVHFALPLAFAGGRLAGPWARRQLQRAFRYRHDVTRADLQAHRGRRPLRVLVSGASGLVGRQLVAFLSTGGHDVWRLARAAVPDAQASRRRGEQTRVAGIRGTVLWDPHTGAMDGATLEGFDAVVHLAGENIAARRWTPEYKARLRDSRIDSTTALARTLATLRQRPAVFACASATGFYGNRGEELLGERADVGLGFLPDLCEQWEAATLPARAAGIRTVNLRLGIVLTPEGGALAKMLPPFRLGGGGPIGSGRQWWSWITLDDVVGAIHHALCTDALRGPCNLVSPQAVPNADFAHTLGDVLRRPSLLPLPAAAVRRIVGEMADALLLASTRALPVALIDTGYAYRHPDLGGALRHLLGRTT